MAKNGHVLPLCQEQFRGCAIFSFVVCYLLLLFTSSNPVFADAGRTISVSKVSQNLDGPCLDPSKEDDKCDTVRVVLTVLNRDLSVYSGPCMEVKVKLFMDGAQQVGCEIKDTNKWQLIHQGGDEFIFDCGKGPTRVLLTNSWLRKKEESSTFLFAITPYLLAILACLVVAFCSVKGPVKAFQRFIKKAFKSLQSTFKTSLHSVHLMCTGWRSVATCWERLGYTAKVDYAPLGINDAVLPKPKKYKKDVKEQEPAATLEAGEPLNADDLLNRELDDADARWMPTLRQEKKRRLEKQAEVGGAVAGEKREPSIAEIAYKKLKQAAIDRYMQRAYHESVVAEQLASQLAKQNQSVSNEPLNLYR
uniref:Uncharacterized protein n=1 Tax=Ditylenchus dipsaci TaxID=166011 RepID=A0A915DMK7_9BILA